MAPVEHESIKVDFDETALLAELQETLKTADKQTDFTEWFADGTSLDIDAGGYILRACFISREK